MGMKSSAYIGTMISLRFFKSLNSVWAKVKSIYKIPFINGHYGLDAISMDIYNNV